MKKILILLFSCINIAAAGQNLISPITITLPANPPAKTADWATAMPPVMITASAKLQNGRIPPVVVESRILVTIKSGGNKVCGTYTTANAPMANFNTSVKNWSGPAVLSLLGQDCTLPPGSYELCVQFYGLNAAQGGLLGESCKPFTIQNQKQESFSPPVNVTPEDKKQLTAKESKTPVIFRWTPVIPRPKVPVNYKLRVWQVNKGQNGTQAMKANTPVVEKDVKDRTEFTKTNLMGDLEMLNRGNEEKNKEYNLVWNVEASKTSQMGDVEMLGSSEATVFKIIITDPSTGCFALDTTQYKVVCKGYNAQGQAIYNISNLILKNTGTNPGRTGLITTGASPYIIPSGFSVTGLSPTSSTSILPGNSIPISFDFSGVSGTTATFYVYSTIPDPAGDVNVACDKRFKVEVDLPSCKCDLCESPNSEWEIQQELYYDSTKTNNILTIHNDISFSPYKVVKLSAEIIDFYWYTEGDCKKCNNNDFYWGNLISGSIKGDKFSQGVSAADDAGVPLPSSHQLDFISNNPTGANISNDVYLNISLPPQTQLSCCTDCFRICARYTVTFMQNGVCKTCSIVKCYETKRKHRKTMWQQATNDCGDRIIHNTGGGVLMDANPVKNN